MFLSVYDVVLEVLSNVGVEVERDQHLAARAQTRLPRSRQIDQQTPILAICYLLDILHHTVLCLLFPEQH